MDTIKFEWDENKNQTNQKTVSYTHLDVYKRQNQKKHGISFEEAKEVFFDDDAILFDDPEPVSYTHLDVYKRQLPIRERIFLLFILA